MSVGLCSFLESQGEKYVLTFPASRSCPHFLAPGPFHIKSQDWQSESLFFTPPKLCCCSHLWLSCLHCQCLRTFGINYIDTTQIIQENLPILKSQLNHICKVLCAIQTCNSHFSGYRTQTSLGEPFILPTTSINRKCFNKYWNVFKDI